MNKKEYMKEYRNKNKDKLQEYSRNYYKENKELWKGYREDKSFPCTYIMYDVFGDVIRIGSTGYLKGRIANYFNSAIYKWGIWGWFNTMKLDRITYIEVDTRSKAYALENYLIEKYNPILNANDVDNHYWDMYRESLGDLTDIEELFEEYDISRYKNIYLNLL